MTDATVTYGSPGCGKSTWLIDSMKDKIAKGYHPDRIALVSFTKAAAHEIAHRVGVKPGNNISTVHSFAFRLLGATRDQMIDSAKLKEFSKKVGVDITGFGSQDGTEYPSVGDFYLSLYAYHRANLHTDLKATYSKSSHDGSAPEFVYFANSYDKWRNGHGYTDFEDLIQKAVDAPAPDVDVLYVDESQDLSKSQWRLINHWAKSIPEVIVAGDANQAIYGWAGADDRGMPDFETLHSANRIVLGQSYRIPKSVWQLATSLIDRCRRRVDYTYESRDEAGHVGWHSDFSQVPIKHGTDTLLLVRNHSLRKEFEERLVAMALPFHTSGGFPSPLQGRFARAVRIVAKAKENHQHMDQLMLDSAEWKVLEGTVFPTLKGKLSSNPEAWVNKHWSKILMMPAVVSNYLSKIERVYGGLDVEPTIRLMTIHASKGREADHVVVFNSMTQKTADHRTVDPDPEIRVFYVAITRAKNRLDIVDGENPLPELY